MTACICMEPGAAASHFARAELGVDPGGGRYADVALWTCRRCGSTWLRYQVEYEGVSRSGRWYRGQVSEAQARSATAENARSILEQLDWYFCGGSYFGAAGRGSGPMAVDL